MPLFKELSAMLRKGDTLVLSVSQETDTTFRVNITPKLFTMDGDKGDDRKALNQPISIVGTVDELDSPEFTAEMNRYAASTVAMRSTIDEVETAHKAAAETKRGSAKAKSSDDDDDEKEKTKKPASKPKPAEPVSATLI